METTYDYEIEQIVKDIFSTVLDIELSRDTEVRDVSLASPHDNMMASIQITGGWLGCVVLGMSSEVARQTAASMFGRPMEHMSNIEECEVAAELVNMIGGNLKSVLPNPCHLSLPDVASGRDFDLNVHNSVLVDNVRMQCASGPIHVELYLRTE